MEPISSSSLGSMAAGANDVMSLVMLRKAMDHNASTISQLLQGLPQKDGAGSLVDVQA